MDTLILTNCLFAVYPIPGTTECIICYADGTADRISRREMKELYGEVITYKGGSIDSPEKLQATIADAMEKSGPSQDFFDDEPHEKPEPGRRKASFDALE